MEGSDIDARSVRAAWALAVGALVAGALYYVFVRAGHPPRALSVALNALPGPLEGAVRTTLGHALPDPSHGTLPSFLHGLAGAAAACALGVRRARRFALGAAALAVPLVLEWRLGTPDPLDAVALFAGAASAALVLRAHAATGRTAEPAGRGAAGPFAPVALLAASLALTAGSEYAEEPGCALYDENGTCSQTKRFATPVYLDKASLRSAVRVEPARPLDRIGQLHAIGTWLFVGETNRGVHVIDNADPAAPVNVGFIRIPGNTEVAVRGTHLYADSYVDLVTLDVSDPSDVRVVDRRRDIFPFDAFQNVPYDIAFRYGDVDESRGVVVGYEE